MTVELLLGALCWEDLWLCKAAIFKSQHSPALPKRGKGRSPRYQHHPETTFERRCMLMVPKLLPWILFMVHSDSL